MFNFSGTRKPDFSNIKKIDYDEYWRDRGFSMREKLMEREKIFINWIKPSSRVLDIGSGNSRLLYELKQEKNCQVKALDVSPLVIDGLKETDIAGEVADIEADDFSITGEYDYMVVSEVLEHMRDPEVLIKRLAPHTNYLVLSIPNSAFYRFRLGLFFKGRFFTQWRYHPSEHLRYWSHKDFLDWLVAMDLEVVKHKASNGFELKNIWPNMFGHQMCYLVKVKNKE